MLTVRHFILVVGLGASFLAQAESLHSQLDVLTQLEEMRTELQTLRGELEVTQHQITQLEQQQRDYYDDLNQRITQVSKTTPQAAPVITPAPAPAPAAVVTPSPGSYNGSEGVPAPAPTVAPGSVSVAVDTTEAVASVNNAGNDLGAYQAAYNLLQNKQYPEAIAAFNQYLTAYPQGEYVANVDYWLGEVYLIQNNYPSAEQAFSRVVNQYPGHQKSADALLKLGYVYEASGDSQKALTAFEQVQQKYPNTAVAQLAQTKATQLKQKIF